MNTTQNSIAHYYYNIAQCYWLAHFMSALEFLHSLDLTDAFYPKQLTFVLGSVEQLRVKSLVHGPKNGNSVDPFLISSLMP